MKQSLSILTVLVLSSSVYAANNSFENYKNNQIKKAEKIIQKKEGYSKRIQTRIKAYEAKLEKNDFQVGVYENLKDCFDSSDNKKDIKECKVEARKALKDYGKKGPEVKDMLYLLDYNHEGATYSSLPQKGKYSIITIDMEDSTPEEIQSLKDNNIEVICYFSAGSYANWRSDAN